MKAADELNEAASKVGAGTSAGAQYEQVKKDFELDYYRDEVPRALEQSTDGMERVAGIVKAMKAFAHPGTHGHKPADLNGAIRSTLAVARNTIRYVADVHEDFGELPDVQCQISDISQVILNSATSMPLRP